MGFLVIASIIFIAYSIFKFVYEEKLRRFFDD